MVMYLKCKMWWFYICIHCEKIPTVKSNNTATTSRSDFSRVCVETLEICALQEGRRLGNSCEPSLLIKAFKSPPEHCFDRIPSFLICCFHSVKNIKKTFFLWFLLWPLGYLGVELVYFHVFEVFPGFFQFAFFGVLLLDVYAFIIVIFKEEVQDQW